MTAPFISEHELDQLYSSLGTCEDKVTSLESRLADAERIARQLAGELEKIATTQPKNALEQFCYQGAPTKREAREVSLSVNWYNRALSDMQHIARQALAAWKEYAERYSIVKEQDD